MDIHPTESLPSARCSPIVYFWGFFLRISTQENHPVNTGTGFLASALPYHQKISSFWVTVLPTCRRNSWAKSGDSFCPLWWAARICNLLCSMKTQSRNQRCLQITEQSITLCRAYLSWASWNDHKPTKLLQKQLLSFSNHLFFISSLQNQTEEPACLNNNEEQTGKFLKWFRLLIWSISGHKIKKKRLFSGSISLSTPKLLLNVSGKFYVFGIKNPFCLHKMPTKCTIIKIQPIDVSVANITPDFQVQEKLLWRILPRGKWEACALKFP